MGSLVSGRMNWDRERRVARVGLAIAADAAFGRATRYAGLIFGPDCKKCGGQTVERFRHDDLAHERPFWGCREWKKCRSPV